MDAEGNGQPDGDAQGDDSGPAPDDEDGVQFPPLYTNQPAAIKVTAINTGTTDAVLYGYIDWNGDFDFSDAGEVVSVTVPAGTNTPTVFTLNYSVPLSAALNTDLGARFRLSTDTAVALPTGRASDGEVEDYIIRIAPTQPDIEVQKYTNGYDAESGTGPLLMTGSGVTWTYVIRNSGNITLTNVTLSDDMVGAVSSCAGGVTLPITMSVGQVVTCTMTGTATSGQYTNTATVSGTDITSPTNTLTDTNASRYYGLTSGLEMTKYTNGFDADSYPDINAPSGSQAQAPTLTVGMPVVWSYVVTNTGDTPLSPIVLVDNQEGVITCPVSTLPAGATMVCTQQGVASVSGVYTNTAIVTGTPTVPTTGTTRFGWIPIAANIDSAVDRYQPIALPWLPAQPGQSGLV
ncbi:MAG: GEVED domain-containing protein [Candidatus Nanopelagicales bacterium]